MPIAQGKGKPFLAFSGLKIRDPATATLSLRSDASGQVGIAWRFDSQQDFPSDQVAHRNLNQSAEFHNLEVPIPAEGQIVHVRVLLPPGNTDLQSFTIQSKGGEGKHWKFRTPEKTPQP
jgi:hypothetical protein